VASHILYAAAPSHAKGVGTPAGASHSSGAERLQKLLDQVNESQSSIRTLHADFTENKDSSLMLEPLRASGEFFYQAPDKVRWEYRAPEPMTLLIQDDELTTWYRDLHEARRTKIGRQSQQVFKYLGMGSSVDNLLEYFDVGLGLPKRSGDPYRLVLTPRYKRVAKRIARLTVWIDSTHHLPTRFLYEEPDGDRTQYEFENLRLNQPFETDPFKLDLPGDVKVREGGGDVGLHP
jgi:outer membrane lipoprotein carrier protein